MHHLPEHYYQMGGMCRDMSENKSDKINITEEERQSLIAIQSKEERQYISDLIKIMLERIENRLKVLQG